MPNRAVAREKEKKKEQLSSSLDAPRWQGRPIFSSLTENEAPVEKETSKTTIKIRQRIKLALNPVRDWFISFSTGFHFSCYHSLSLFLSVPRI